MREKEERKRETEEAVDELGDEGDLLDVVGTRLEEEDADEEVQRAVVAEEGPHDLRHGVGVAGERHRLELHGEGEQHLVVAGDAGPLDLAVEVGHDGEHLLQPGLHDEVVEVPLHRDARLPVVRHCRSARPRSRTGEEVGVVRRLPVRLVVLLHRLLHRPPVEQLLQQVVVSGVYASLRAASPTLRENRVDLAGVEHGGEPLGRDLEGGLDRAALHRLHVLYARSAPQRLPIVAGEGWSAWLLRSASSSIILEVDGVSELNSEQVLPPTSRARRICSGCGVEGETSAGAGVSQSSE